MILFKGKIMQCYIGFQSIINVIDKTVFVILLNVNEY